MVAAHLVAAARKTYASLTGVVVSAGKMDRTVKVRVGAQKWNKQVQKNFTKPNSFLCHDPNNSIRTGDIVSITGGWKKSKSKRHVVQSIIRPAGIPVEERPPLMDQEQLWADAIAQHAAKRERKEARREARRLEEEAAGNAPKAVKVKGKNKRSFRPKKKGVEEEASIEGEADVESEASARAVPEGLGMKEMEKEAVKQEA